MHLESEGHERWLNRGRLTAEMTAALLDHTLFSWEAIAEERAMHPADERARIVELLRRRIATRRIATEEERRCLRAMERLDWHVTNSGGPPSGRGFASRWRRR